MRMFLCKLICPTSHRVVPYVPTSKMKQSACASMSPAKREGKPWARKHGARGPEWDAAHVLLMVMADKFNAREWVKAEMEARG